MNKYRRETVSTVRALAYLFVPYLVFFASFLMFSRWWSALIELGVFGIIAWKFAHHYDRHHDADKFTISHHLLSRSDAIDRYVETYGSSSADE